MATFFRAMIGTCLLLAALMVQAGDSTGVALSFGKERLNAKEVLLSIKATIPAGTKLYALQKTEADVLYSSIQFDTAFSKILAGSITESGKLEKEKDAAMGAEVAYFSDSVLWQQK